MLEKWLRSQRDREKVHSTWNLHISFSVAFIHFHTGSNLWRQIKCLVLEKRKRGGRCWRNNVLIGNWFEWSWCNVLSHGQKTHVIRFVFCPLFIYFHWIEFCIYEFTRVVCVLGRKIKINSKWIHSDFICSNIL